jgi:hypothetical protein
MPASELSITLATGGADGINNIGCRHDSTPRIDLLEWRTPCAN